MWTRHPYSEPWPEVYRPELRTEFLNSLVMNRTNGELLPSNQRRPSHQSKGFASSGASIIPETSSGWGRLLRVLKSFQSSMRGVRIEPISYDIVSGCHWFWDSC